MNIAEKFMAIMFVLCLLGAVVLFSGTSSEEGYGLFDTWTNISSMAETGNVTEFTGTAVALLPIGFIAMFFVFVGVVIFKL